VALPGRQMISTAELGGRSGWGPLEELLEGFSPDLTGEKNAYLVCSM